MIAFDPRTPTTNVRRARFGPLWVALWLAALASGCGGDDTLSLRAGIDGRRAVLLVGSERLRKLLPASTRGIAETDRPGIGALLDGDDGEALAMALKREGVDGIVVEISPQAKEPAPARGGAEEGVRVRLQRYAVVEGFRAVFLDVDAAFYELYEDDRFSPEVGEAMARVARVILSGSPPPPITSFPEPLRRLESVEMMVLLKHRSEHRLWRSARASSVARALTTAAVTARERWEERQAAMGGDLSFRLPTLDVEVYVVIEDGTLLSRAPSFVERVFTSEHGVAYEQRGATWKYSLPSERDGSAVESYADLFESQGLVKASLGRQDVRLYRMRLKRVGVAPAIR